MCYKQWMVFKLYICPEVQKVWILIWQSAYIVVFYFIFLLLFFWFCFVFSSVTFLPFSFFDLKKQFHKPYYSVLDSAAAELCL